MLQVASSLRSLVEAPLGSSGDHADAGAATGPASRSVAAQPAAGGEGAAAPAAGQGEQWQQQQQPGGSGPGSEPAQGAATHRHALTSQCQAMATLVRSRRCAAFSDAWLPYALSLAERRARSSGAHPGGPAAAHAVGSGSGHRFSSASGDAAAGGDDGGDAGAGAADGGGGDDSSESDDGAPPPAITEQPGSRVVDSADAVKNPDPVPIAVTGVAGDVLLWEPPAASLCFRGTLIAPRKAAAAVLLGDGVTAVVYGGHGETHGGLYDASTIGTAFPLTPATLNDTYLLSVVARDQADDMDAFPYACTAEESDKREALRVLPSARRGPAILPLSQRAEAGVFVAPGAPVVQGGNTAARTEDGGFD